MVLLHYVSYNSTQMLTLLKGIQHLYMDLYYLPTITNSITLGNGICNGIINLGDLVFNLKSSQLFEMFVSANSRNLLLELVHHHCASGPGDHYDRWERCHWWLCEYLLLGSNCIFLEAGSGNLLGILNETLFSDCCIILFWYLFSYLLIMVL